MERFLWICLAGAAGTGARYLVALWAAQRFGSAFPYGTLFVNLLGCFAIAAVMQTSLEPSLRSELMPRSGRCGAIRAWPRCAADLPPREV